MACQILPRIMVHLDLERKGFPNVTDIVVHRWAVFHAGVGAAAASSGPSLDRHHPPSAASLDHEPPAADGSASASVEAEFPSGAEPLNDRAWAAPPVRIEPAAAAAAASPRPMPGPTWGTAWYLCRPASTCICRQ